MLFPWSFASGGAWLVTRLASDSRVKTAGSPFIASFSTLSSTLHRLEADFCEVPLSFKEVSWETWKRLFFLRRCYPVPKSIPIFFMPFPLALLFLLKCFCMSCMAGTTQSRTSYLFLGMKKMEYKGKQWHDKCFCCAHCKNPIGTKSFIPKNEEVYCGSCYEEKFATRCSKCRKVGLILVFVVWTSWSGGVHRAIVLLVVRSSSFTSYIGPLMSYIYIHGVFF